MKFNIWLKAQQKRKDPIGDLARDAYLDNEKLPSSKKSWVDMLCRCGACDGAFDALNRAYKEWKYETTTPPRKICK